MSGSQDDPIFVVDVQELIALWERGAAASKIVLEADRRPLKKLSEVVKASLMLHLIKK